MGTKGGRRAMALGVGLAALLGTQLVGAPPASAEVCTTRAIANTTFSVTVCLVTPAPGDVLTGKSDMTATATVNPPGAATIDRMVFWWGPEPSPMNIGADFDPPYRMVLDSTQLPDGPGRISARAVLPSGAVSSRSGANVAISNPNPPPDDGTFEPWTGDRDPERERYRLAAVGDGVDGSPESHGVIQQIAAADPDMVAYLGDVYDRGTYPEFDTWYTEPGGWGQFVGYTNPTIGNHEYRTANGAPYFDFWDEVPHHYSYDIGGWHVIVLDSSTEFAQVLPGTPQFNWITADLEANRSECTMMYAHHARYTNVDGVSRGGLKDIWELLVDKGADLILAGHAHTYERWVPMDRDGVPATEGITQFVVGTGGRPILNTKGQEPRVAAEVTKPGALILDLGPTDAQFRFASTDGSFTDSGTIPCRTPPEVSSTVDSTVPGNDGWHRGDVTLTWETSDPESPVVETGCVDTVVATDQPETTYDCTATSGGGVTDGEPVKIKRDATAPSVTCDDPGATFLVQGGGTVTATVSDALSGPVNGSVSAPADTAAVGPFSVSLEGADVAGNTHNQSCGYRVEYDFIGWQPPVADEPAVNVVAAGQIVPLKWRLLDAAGAPVTTLSSAAVSTAPHACDAGVPEDPVDEVAVGGSGLQNLGEGYYQYNWRTIRTYAGTCRTVRLDLAEGELHTAEFRFSG